MPVSSLIIGVDLVPIKPIPNVVTLQEDITTEKCRQALRKELQTWKVDVVLNDGAPNVGASWVHDAYSQANLTLMALKLACEFLCKGGWFITKVFRSRDYQPLLWIFQQFFQKVQATKPQASRNESAEIFVVCQGYQAPDKIDSKFFDPKHAFKEVEVQTKSVSELVSKKKPKAEGYADGDTTLYHRFTLMDFLKAPNPVDFLSKANEITLGDGELENHSSTTEELRQCCKDIRVLGRKELRALLNWRTKLRRFLAKKLKEQAKELDINLSSGEEEEGREEEEKKVKKMVPEAAADEVEKEEEEVELALAEMKAKELAELKRKKKKILKEQRKQRERVELKMDLPGVSIADDGDTSMFSLRSIHRTPLLDELSRGDMASADTLLEMGPGDDDIYVSDHEEEDDVSLDSDLDPEELLEIEARQRKLERERREQGGKRAKFKQKEEEEEEGEEEENPLLVPLEEKSVLEERQTSLWFGKDAFAGIEDDADEDLELGQAQMLAERQRESQRDKATKKGQKKKQVLQEEAPAEPPPATDAAPGTGEAQDEQSSDDDSSSDEERPPTAVRGKRGRVEPCGFEVVPIENPVKRARVLDAEGLALGSVIATSRKARRDLIDDSFNRYSYNEEEGELPEWFTEEEKQHRCKQVPVDRQTVEAYRQRWREINARPIKKVAEAKARKKRRMLKKMEQMKKKAEAVVDTVDISEREKVAQLRRIYKKAGLAKEKRQVTYLVAKKGVGPRVRRPPGVKGQFKVVDSRLKKDVRAQKRKEQKKKRHK
ncbi:pre-rRNA 2'-O-ribose RNA methyltransferase FTSJ3 [Manacus vitellinus]|uniref:pre-rRNA 2'-O-ribose RNA methyltransferase FTSJ3 n=1 Tax=Manacus vitellinus TaxID=328815 RepID=UPI000846F5C5|nr:pre-rRNA 2'-O-ribose RNA methyltransferase FTSJ3 [Manacus vitellinus]